MTKLAFIGGGKMAEALLQGILEANIFTAKEIVVTDISADRLSYLSNKFNVLTSINNIQAIQNAQYIIIAVKPQQIESVLTEIHQLYKEPQIIISIAAGIKIETLSQNKPIRVARAMPNTPALIGQGMTAVAFSNSISTTEKQFVLKLFSAVGQAIELPEEQINAVTALSGSGPAFVFKLIEYFAQAGAKLGLAKETALLLAKQTFSGSSLLAIQSDKNLSELIEQVTSPKGTTAAGREILENSNAQEIIQQTLQKANERAIELSKK